MNKHIELVKKWLDDPKSVTLQELRDNAEAAYDAADAAWADYAAYDAYDAAWADDAVAAAQAAYDAAYWVKKYEKLTGEK